MKTDYILLDESSLLNNMANSKQDLLAYIAWVDGDDSPEYELYKQHIDESDVRLFVSKFWNGDPDNTMECLLDFVEYKELVEFIKHNGTWNDEIEEILNGWNTYHIKKFSDMATWDEHIGMEVLYYNFYTVEGGYIG